MVRRSREINIFSLSALDLFASALGAFIVIALVMIPTFPNVSRIVVLTPPTPEPPPPVPPAPSDTQFPDLDLVIVVDLTSSMKDVLEGLKGEIDHLTRFLALTTPSLSVGMVGYGDRYWRAQRLASFPLQPISGSTSGQAALKAFVLGLSMNMGCSVPTSACPEDENNDYEEDFVHALREAMAMGWRSESERKVILMLTDAPAYPEEVELAVADAGSFAGLGPGREVSTVFFDTRRYAPWEIGRGDIETFLERVADAGGGQFSRSGASFLATIILALM